MCNHKADRWKKLPSLPLLVLVLVALIPAPAAYAQEDIDCGRCHRKVTLESPAHQQLDCGDCHTNVVSRRHKAEDLADLTGDLICAQCHSLAAKSVSRSIHEGDAGCADCHGAPHEIRTNDDLGSPMSPVGQISACGECHRSRDGLIEGFVESVHGRGLLKGGLLVAPSCSSCHGSHRILEVRNERAPTADANSPEMCGECHLLVLQSWSEESDHGAAWQSGDPQAPVCTTCHSSHQITDPSLPSERLHLPEHCGDCHGERYSSYRDNFHGKFTQLGLVTSATCSDCHTPHQNRGADHPASSIHPDNLSATCGQCHGDAPPAFMQIGMHNDPTSPEDNVYVYWVYIFMMGLLIGVFAFFGIHDLLWLQRALVGSLRGEFPRHKRLGPEKGPYVRRFRPLYIGMHAVVLITFLLLALTGLPLKFDQTAWAQQLMNLLGGVHGAGVIHRLAAIGTFGYMVFHLIHLLIRVVVRHERGLFWGPHSMTPQWRDVKDLVANVRYFLYLGPHPGGDRFTYWEKFDYLAVFWGVMVIGLSGLMLWVPEFFTRFLPGWTINAAYVVHSDEALLATGFIFLFHFFHTHLRPESFPMDPVVFTGRMPLEKFKEERPREYQRMVDKGLLESALCDPPTKEELTWVYVFGFTAVSIGLALAVGIFWALLTHGL